MPDAKKQRCHCGGPASLEVCERSTATDRDPPFRAACEGCAEIVYATGAPPPRRAES